MDWLARTTCARVESRYSFPRSVTEWTAGHSGSMVSIFILVAPEKFALYNGDD